MSLKLLGPNSGSTVDAVEVINYAVVNGADISNNSWGYLGAPNRSLRDAITRADNAGHLFVAAAGNGGADSVGDNNDANSSNTNYPSSYGNLNIISVAATDNGDTLDSFSNFGASTVDLSAPGVNAYSTLPTSSGSAFGYYSGTSMATPHVAGVAALLKSQQPTLDDAQLKTRILDGVDAKGTLSGRVLTGGRLNAANALPASSSADRATDTTVPTVTQVSPSRTRDRTPRIAATVSGDRAKLAQGDKTLTLDGRDRTGAIAYDAGANRLVYDSVRLSMGQHKVEITATDEAGNTTTATKSFRVVRR